MSERGLSETAMLASLQDIHLPTEAAGGWLADLAASIGVAALLACGIIMIARLVSTRRTVKRTLTLAEQIAALDGASRIALLHVLKQHAPERYAVLQGELYRPDELDLERIEAEVARV